MKSSSIRCLSMALFMGILFSTGCEDPISSIVRSKAEATARMREIDAEREVEMARLDLAREQMAHDLAMEELRLAAHENQAAEHGEPDVDSEDPTETLEDYSVVSSSDSAHLENPSEK